MEWSRGLTSQSRAPENERFDSASENTQRAPRSSGARGRDVGARGQRAVSHPAVQAERGPRWGKPGVRAAETGAAHRGLSGPAGHVSVSQCRPRRCRHRADPSRT